MRIKPGFRKGATAGPILTAILVALLALSGCAEFSWPVRETPFWQRETAAATIAPETDLPEELPVPAIEVFFNGNDDQARILESALVAALDGAGQSVDMAMYNFSLDAVGEALLDAKARGVRVRIVAESDALDGRWFGRFRAANIKVQGDGREALMHNKFLILDGREVWTGSLNLTPSGTTADDNNFVRLVSAELAQRYGAVFEAMFTAGEFGPDRTAPAWDPALDVGGVPVEVYFSPEDHPEQRLVELVRGAKKSIRVLAYSFTSDALAEALRDQAGAGLTIQGVFDESQADGQGAEYAPLRQAGLDVRLDGSSGLMHNKVLVIDDKIVVTGSYNFTRAANQSNDENLVVVFDASIAAQYREIFDQIYQAGR